MACPNVIALFTLPSISGTWSPLVVVYTHSLHSRNAVITAQRVVENVFFYVYI